MSLWYLVKHWIYVEFADLYGVPVCVCVCVCVRARVLVCMCAYVYVNMVTYFHECLYMWLYMWLLPQKIVYCVYMSPYW